MKERTLAVGVVVKDVVLFEVRYYLLTPLRNTSTRPDTRESRCSTGPPGPFPITAEEILQVYTSQMPIACNLHSAIPQDKVP